MRGIPHQRGYNSIMEQQKEKGKRKERGKHQEKSKRRKERIKRTTVLHHQTHQLDPRSKNEKPPKTEIDGRKRVGMGSGGKAYRSGGRWWTPGG